MIDHRDFDMESSEKPCRYSPKRQAGVGVILEFDVHYRGDMNNFHDSIWSYVKRILFTLVNSPVCEIDNEF